MSTKKLYFLFVCIMMSAEGAKLFIIIYWFHPFRKNSTGLLKDFGKDRIKKISTLTLTSTNFGFSIESNQLRFPGSNCKSWSFL